MPLDEKIVLAAIALATIVMAYLRLGHRVVIAVAFAVLISSAITQLLGMKDLSEQLAIYTFYLLAAGVVLLLIYQIREGSKGSK
jgi:hypothetical protein